MNNLTPSNPASQYLINPLVTKTVNEAMKHPNWSVEWEGNHWKVGNEDLSTTDKKTYSVFQQGWHNFRLVVSKTYRENFNKAVSKLQNAYSSASALEAHKLINYKATRSQLEDKFREANDDFERQTQLVDQHTLKIDLANRDIKEILDQERNHVIASKVKNQITLSALEAYVQAKEESEKSGFFTTSSTKSKLEAELKFHEDELRSSTDDPTILKLLTQKTDKIKPFIVTLKSEIEKLEVSARELDEIAISSGEKFEKLREFPDPFQRVGLLEAQIESTKRQKDSAEVDAEAAKSKMQTILQKLEELNREYDPSLRNADQELSETEFSEKLDEPPGLQDLDKLLPELELPKQAPPAEPEVLDVSLQPEPQPAEKPERSHVDAFIEELENPEFQTLFNTLFTRVTNVLKSDPIADYKMTSPGTYEFTLKEPVRLWVPTPEGKIDPEGGAILLLGENAKKKCVIRIEGHHLEFKEGFQVYARVPMNKRFVAKMAGIGLEVIATFEKADYDENSQKIALTTFFDTAVHRFPNMQERTFTKLIQDWGTKSEVIKFKKDGITKEENTEAIARHLPKKPKK